jgi:CRISPR/Cas system endoribonuclease Cas6 (RAMP superfamily)
MGILCHLDVICSKKVAEVIYNFGIGQLNGSGFGMVYCTQNHNIYRNTIKKMELIGV